MRHCLLLLCLGAAAYAQTLPAEIAAELTAAERLPIGGTYTYQATWQSETNAGHHTGQVADVDSAQGGQAWSVVVGRDRVEASALFGPYAEVPAGDYVAFYRLRLAAPADDDLLGVLDASVNGGAEIMIQQPLYVSDLSADRWSMVPLAFHVGGPRLEVRLHWTGAADLLIDSVTLYAVAGGTLPDSARRVPAPHYSGEPNNLPYAWRQPEQLFDQSAPPAERLEVIDLRRVSNDVRHLMLSLQGLVNREQPRIYSILHDTDQTWLNALLEHGGVQTAETIDTPAELLARHRPLVRGAVVADAREPCSKNVAMMVASVEDALVASPRLAREFDLPIIEDLRGRFADNVDGYRWAWETLRDRLNHHAAAVLWPENAEGLRDYLYQHRIFTFWISGPLDGARPGHDAQGETELMEEILAELPPNIPIYGYPWAGKDIGIGEGPGVTLFAQFAKYLVGTVGTTNLSVHTGVRLPDHRQPRYAAPPLDRTKVYITWVMSDGDNLPVLTVGNFPQLWAQPERGQTPMAWTISPAAHLLTPVIADYYYRSSTANDAWIGSVSGIGYTYPDEYGKRYGAAGQRQAFDDFLALTARYGKALDLRQMWIMGIRNPELIARYAAGVPDLTAIFPDYGKVVDSYDDAFYLSARGIPIFHAATHWSENDTREERIARTVDYIRHMTPAERPAFLHLFIWNWGTDLAQQLEVERRLGPDYVAVRPEHLASLGRQALDEQVVQLKLPTTVTALTGSQLRVPGTIRNVSRQAVEVDLNAMGLGSGGVRPARIALQPGASQPFTIAGRAARDTVTVRVQGPLPTALRSFAVRLLDPSEVADGGGLAGQPSHEFAASQLSHTGGQPGSAAGALAPRIWTVEPGRDEPGHAVYGPYVPLEPGAYTAYFRLRRPAGSGAEPTGTLATIDAHLGGGGPLGERVVTANDLPAGAWRLVPVEFEHPGGQIETRVHWPGSAPLEIDTILIRSR